MGNTYLTREKRRLRGGSSPRAWGTHRAWAWRLRHPRIIPTCVGNTGIARCVHQRPSDHPHVRGEHGQISVPQAAYNGSSPRAWGTLGDGVESVDAARIIPTCVGNTVDILPGGTIGTDHPHVRGEHLGRVSAGMASTGSSPRAWGTRILKSFMKLCFWIIPTCVGNTEACSCLSGACSDHPHVRGEHPISMKPKPHPAGSSPRAWGTLSGKEVGRMRRRIIPTCVGNTPGKLFPTLPHPGSSPRAWGTLSGKEVGRMRRRIIPTCVGNTNTRI